MRNKSFSKFTATTAWKGALVLCLVVLAAVASPRAQAQTYTVLYSFTGASTCRSIVDVTSGPNNGHCTFLWESFTPNAWCPSTRKDYDFSTARFQKAFGLSESSG